MADMNTPLTEAEIQKLVDEHNKGGAFVKVSNGQTCWDAGIEILPSCGHMKPPKFHVYFEPLADQKIKKLQSYYSSLEWLMYLEGEVDHEKHTVTVTDLVLPESQQVTGCNVYNVEYGWNEGRSIIGVIHSHHNMGAFFSGTDDAYINQNHDVSIVVATNANSPIKGQVRVKTPCDSYVLVENVTFSVKSVQVLDEDEFEKQFTEKIHTFKPTPVTYIGNGLGNFSRGYSGGNYNHGNPSRTSQRIPSSNRRNLLGYDTEQDDDYPDVFKMSKTELREHLSGYYTPEEIEEFENDDELADELNMIQELCREGVNVGTLDYIQDCNSQNGSGQVGHGIALRDQQEDVDSERGVWELEEEDVDITETLN